MRFFGKSRYFGSSQIEERVGMWKTGEGQKPRLCDPGAGPGLPRLGGFLLDRLCGRPGLLIFSCGYSTVVPFGQLLFVFS